MAKISKINIPGILPNAEIEVDTAIVEQTVQDYLAEHPIEAPVQSVNGKTGAVVLNATDVGALPADTPIPTVPTKVSAFENDAGYLTQHQSLAAYRTASAQDTIDAAQDTAIAGKYSKPSGGIPASDLAAGVIPAVPTKVSDLTNDSGYQTAQQVQTAIANLQTQSITDTGGYYSADTVEGALQEIGAELAGINTLIGSGVIS